MNTALFKQEKEQTRVNEDISSSHGNRIFVRWGNRICFTDASTNRRTSSTNDFSLGFIASHWVFLDTFAGFS